MKSGTIFDVKEFAVHDGPGVRQTVFFKGCTLRCQWCHNPEGLSAKPQLMFSRSSCSSCGKCRQVCPLTEQKEIHAPASPEGCTACGACVEVCPLGLRQISGKKMSSRELVSLIRENSDYYAALGGGVTFSGGEPLMQGEFLLEVLDQIPDLHTAIETSAYAPSDLFQAVTDHLSFIMMYVKLMDPVLHRHYTGADNRIILENLTRLCRGKKEFVVRIPLIPGVNNTEENLEQTAAFLSGAPSLLRVELLPYHQTAGAKYSMVGMEYRPEFDTSAPLQIPEHIFEKYKIRSVVL